MYKLHNAEQGKVITRFPPEASGYLHIGHAKAAIINFSCKNNYNGKLLLRFDDTNPDKENVEFEKIIIEDLKLLGINWDLGPTFESDYFDYMIEKATELIKNGLVYCDNTDKETMQKDRLEKKMSYCRDKSVEENLKVWKDMQNGTDDGLNYCLRAKIFFDSANGALRDPVIYRCNLTSHPRTKDKYKVYPTYDFACPLIDSLEGVTHALRTNEYHDRNAQYYWFCDKLNIRKPIIEDYSRLNMQYTLMSKRKLTYIVDNKYVNGWDDPRLPTVRGMLRRGMQVEALHQFINIQGMSKVVNRMEWHKLWNINKKIIDPIAPRYTAINNDHKIIATITGLDINKFPKSKPLHPKNLDLGSKPINYSSDIYLEKNDVALLNNGDEITLMTLGNAFINDITDDNCKLTLKENTTTEDIKKTKYKLHWLSASNNKPVIFDIYEYDNLFTEEVPDGDLAACLAKKSLYISEMIGEESMSNLKKGDVIQLDRRDFCIVDRTEPKIIFNIIPNGTNKINHLSPKAYCSKE
jgi:glutamyl-tRNA synthetase